MKKYLVVSLLVFALLLPGCESLTPTYTWTFANNSSWEILISPNGQSWSPFALFPGDERDVTLEADRIYYVWWSDHGQRITTTIHDESNTFFFWNK